MKCRFCQEPIHDDEPYVLRWHTRKLHVECAGEGEWDDEYFPPKGEFPSDEDLQHQELQDERI